MGAVGALVGGAFVAACDAVRARSVPPSRRREVLVRAGAGLGAGLLALRYPQSLFWGEQSLQMAIDGVSAPEALLYPVALQGPRAAAPFGLGLGAAKLAAIALAAGAGCPGGVIFPLFFAAGALAHGAIAAAHLPAATVALLMAAVQASVTRTPLSTALMLAFSGNLGRRSRRSAPSARIPRSPRRARWRCRRFSATRDNKYRIVCIEDGRQATVHITALWPAYYEY